MFEKYDGVRGFWNPLKRAFYSRRGFKFTIPQEIVDAMPGDIFLDGELWYALLLFTPANQIECLSGIRFGRDNFHYALRLVNKTSSEGLDWGKFRYMVFDVPNNTGVYRERYDVLRMY